MVKKKYSLLIRLLECKLRKLNREIALIAQSATYLMTKQMNLCSCSVVTSSTKSASQIMFNPKYRPWNYKYSVLKLAVEKEWAKRISNLALVKKSLLSMINSVWKSLFTRLNLYLDALLLIVLSSATLMVRKLLSVPSVQKLTV